MEVAIKQPDDAPGAQLPGLPPGVITPPGLPASAALPPPAPPMEAMGGGAGFNPTGSNAPAPSGAAPPGAGGQPGIPAAPQGFAPLNTVSPAALPGV